VRTLSDYFDVIYVITLKRAGERHRFVKKELNGLDFQFFFGVDGNKLDVSLLEEKGLYNSEIARKRKYGHSEMTLGEIGCALSHLNVYKDIVSKNYERALILEDDVFIKTEMSGKSLFNILNELPKDWDLCYFGYNEIGKKIGFSVHLRQYFLYPLLFIMGIKKFNPFKYYRRFSRNYSENLNISGCNYGTHAYAVTNKCAQKILDNRKVVIEASDYLLSTFCQSGILKAFNLKRKIFYQQREKLKSMINH